MNNKNKTLVQKTMDALAGRSVLGEGDTYSKPPFDQDSPTTKLGKLAASTGNALAGYTEPPTQADQPDQAPVQNQAPLPDQTHPVDPTVNN